MLTEVLLINITFTLLGGDGGESERVKNSAASLKFPTPTPFSAITWYQYKVFGRRCVNKTIGSVELTVN